MTISIIAPTAGVAWNIGGRLTCKVRSADTDGAYTILELILPPGGGAPRHSHTREDELFYLVDGVCEFSDDEGQMVAPTGAWVRIPRGVAHAFRNPGAEPCKLLITAVPGGLDNYFEELNAAITGGAAGAEQVNAINEKYGLLF
jgi:mannose-6-phosphate isomerase-like protein (cupin superfamily)